jgi:hypothetical protein
MRIRFKKPTKWYYLIGWDIDINLVVPKKWNELSEFQLKMIGRFMFNNRNEQLETKYFKQVVTSILIIPKPTLKNIVKSVILFLQAPFSDLEQYADFIFDKKELLTRFPSQIKIGRWPFRKTVFGPAPRMANSTIEELSYADTFYYKWITENNTDDLHRLMAILYRPSSELATPEDKRKPFSSLLLESNSRITDAIPLHIKFMIAHTYYGCRENFINRNPHVFPRKKITEGEEEKIPPKPKPYQSFSKIIDSFAMDEVQIFGNHQQVEKVFASKFLMVYEESIIRQKERERKNGK